MACWLLSAITPHPGHPSKGSTKGFWALTPARDRLAEHGTDEVEYLSFLSGNYYDQKMLSIDYNMVTTNITNYVKGYEIYFNNFTRMSFNSKMVDERKGRAGHSPGIIYFYSMHCVPHRILGVILAE